MSNDDSNVNTDDFLNLAGVTIENADANIFIYKEEGNTKSAIASNDNSTTVAEGAIIDTNGTKGYFKMTANTANDDSSDANTSIDVTSNTPIFALKVNDRDKVTAGSDELVKTDAILTVTVKFTDGGTVGAKGLTAMIAVDGATVGGTYATAAVVDEFAAGETFTTTTEAELDFTLSGFTAAVSAVKVTLSDEA